MEARRVWRLALAARLLFLMDGGVWSLRNVTISVPRAVLSGAAATLRCSYDLEGAPLYSIRWYRAETEFYRYVPREMPPHLVFPLPGASVDLAASDSSQVRVAGLHRRLSGEYQCEVSADAPLFHTDIRSAHLTVVDPPFRAPQLAVERFGYARGELLRANCSVDESFPAPNISWLLDNVKIAERISSWAAAEVDWRERPAFSQLEVVIEDGTGTVMGDSAEGEQTRVSLPAPPGGRFSLKCEASIFDIYTRSSVAVTVREDAPQPASVTGDRAPNCRVRINVNHCNSTLSKHHSALRRRPGSGCGAGGSGCSAAVMMGRARPPPTSA